MADLKAEYRCVTCGVPIDANQYGTCGEHLSIREVGEERAVQALKHHQREHISNVDCWCKPRVESYGDE